MIGQSHGTLWRQESRKRWFVDEGGRFPANYHVYRVVQTFVAMAGPIEGWFEQPGQGVQFVNSDSLGLCID